MGFRIKSAAGKYPVLIPYIAVVVGLYLFSSAWLSLLLYHGLMLVYIIFDRMKNVPVKRRKINIRRTIFLSAICSFAGVLAYLLWGLVRKDNIELEIRLAGYGLSGVGKYIFILYFSTVHPFLEEVFWRIKLNDSTRVLSFNDLAFAGYHLLVVSLFIKIPFVIISFIGLIIISAVWRAVYRKYGDVITLFASHAAADMSIIVVALIFLK
jgi:hypothetical protein